MSCKPPANHPRNHCITSPREMMALAANGPLSNTLGDGVTDIPQAGALRPVRRAE
jgi:hypothetical protein